MLIEHDPNRWKRFVVSLVLFLIVAGMVASNSMILQVLDSVFQALFGPNPNHIHNGTYTLMKTISFLGSPKLDLFWMLVITALLWYFKYKIPAVWSWCLIIGADALGFIVKHLVHRARPLQHLASDDGYSFPSGHVTGFFIICAVLFVIVVPLIKKASVRVICQLLLIFGVVIMAISRVYMYAHYPFDTIGAMLLAYAWLQFAEVLYLTFAPNLTSWKFLADSKY